VPVHQLELVRLRRERILERRVEPERARRARDQLGRGFRVAAREERHIVPQPDELLGEIRDDPFRAAVKLGRHAFGERCNLRDLHRTPSSICNSRARLGDC